MLHNLLASSVDASRSPRGSTISEGDASANTSQEGESSRNNQPLNPNLSYPSYVNCCLEPFQSRLSKFFIQKPIRRILLRQLLNPFHSYPMVSHLSLTIAPMPTSAPTKSCSLMSSSPVGLEFSQQMDLARS